MAGNLFRWTRYVFIIHTYLKTNKAILLKIGISTKIGEVNCVNLSCST